MSLPVIYDILGPHLDDVQCKQYDIQAQDRAGSIHCKIHPRDHSEVRITLMFSCFV